MGYSWNTWVFLIALLAAGIFAILDLIKKQSKEAGEVLEKITPYAGYIGIGLIVFSIWNLFDVLRVFGLFIQVLPLTTIVLLAGLIGGVLLGIMQSLGLLKSWKILNEEAGTKVEGKLIPFRIPLGFIAIISSLYMIVFGIVGGWML